MADDKRDVFLQLTRQQADILASVCVSMIAMDEKPTRVRKVANDHGREHDPAFPDVLLALDTIIEATCIHVIAKLKA